MNKFQKNIVLVGFSDIEIRSISIPPVGDVIYLNDIKQANYHQGYLLVINNRNNIDIVSFDKKYRKTINKYAKVWLYNENYIESKHKWSKIEFVNRNIFEIDELTFWEDYDLYKENIKEINKIKYTPKRLNNIERIYNYLKIYRIVTTSQMSKDLNISERMIQRYMHDINILYKNIGYDYSNNQWYIIW